VGVKKLWLSKKKPANGKRKHEAFYARQVKRRRQTAWVGKRNDEKIAHSFDEPVNILEEPWTNQMLNGAGGAETGTTKGKGN